MRNDSASTLEAVAPGLWEAAAKSMHHSLTCDTKVFTAII